MRSIVVFVGFGPVPCATFYRVRSMTFAQRSAAEERVRDDARRDVATWARRTAGACAA